jgi:hypothetical protein
VAVDLVTVIVTNGAGETAQISVELQVQQPDTAGDPTP